MAKGLTYVLDQNLSRNVLEVLKGSRVEPLGRITSLDELGFAGDVDDIDWLSALGRTGNHCVVTRDGDILQAALERNTWASSGVSLLVLAGKWGTRPLRDLVRGLLYWWPYMVEYAEAGKPGTAWTVKADVPSPPANGIRLVRGPGTPS